MCPVAEAGTTEIYLRGFAPDWMLLLFHPILCVHVHQLLYGQNPTKALFNAASVYELAFDCHFGHPVKSCRHLQVRMLAIGVNEKVKTRFDPQENALVRQEEPRESAHLHIIGNYSTVVSQRGSEQALNGAPGERGWSARLREIGVYQMAHHNHVRISADD